MGGGRMLFGALLLVSGCSWLGSSKTLSSTLGSSVEKTEKRFEGTNNFDFFYVDSR